ncbi:PTS transporter subunit EIIC [Listeria seeligeri]|uniref:alpha-glucoside-specific PTS transporter subunit IIBC n=1 Tax=Listeria seeligeri TaxID=1640 RepID=UPI0010D543FA|nr:alpha-glucoside-specific PTS transporter subunit IIBC [Listeria seeligeri]MBC1420548.1 PTS transporter subunit EIIC [Listeria seeligeri]MBC1750238.1 PTS transporter subunit EIIC [Listeria seeligeri]MBC1828436.1 PTS transporter subunit EIIC [Listeria seeligeri]MBC1843977.1 PTS transporter subunit EIIC [Listeria seeligeri]MBC2232445.1 PTS transporter subunit EIIC [Listeria seeligeri]
MMKKVQRFGGAMLTPVLLFSFAGVVVGFAILFMNEDIMGDLASPDSLWYQIWNVIAEGAWTVFRQMPLLFVIGLPIGLAKKESGRACLEALVTYITFNYFLSAILTTWGSFFGVDMAQEAGGTSGLALIASIKTIDTGMFGALIISGIVVYLHNRYFDTELPEVLGVFRGTSFVVILGFIVMLPIAFLFAFIWPHFQSFMLGLQGFFISSGNIGVWIYSFLQEILIPTGLHHFIYAPFAYDSAVVPGGMAAYWATHLGDFQTTANSLKEMYPAGGFALSGMSKVFGSIGIVFAFYKTARPEKRKAVLGLMIPVAATAVFAGITEPLEFTFLFVAPVLFVVHAVLAATASTVAYAFGVVGDFGGGLINWFAVNWLPLWKYHWTTYVTQIIVGLAFAFLWYIIFVFIIKKMDLKTPGREPEDSEVKFYTKADYKEKKEGGAKGKKKENQNQKKAVLFLEALGGSENITDVTNCATRLRLTLKDPELMGPDAQFLQAGAHGVVRNGQAIQIIVGLSVPSVRSEFENLLNEKDEE